MNTPSKPWWKKRRIVWPSATLILLFGALAIAILRSNSSQIILYNDTGAPLGPLVVHACGQEVTFAKIEDENSVRMRLKPVGGESSIELSLPANPAWRWEGGYLEPKGGYLVFIHVRQGLEVEIHTQISFWQQVLFGRNPGGG